MFDHTRRCIVKTGSFAPSMSCTSSEGECLSTSSRRCIVKTGTFAPSMSSTSSEGECLSTSSECGYLSDVWHRPIRQPWTLYRIEEEDNTLQKRGRRELSAIQYNPCRKKRHISGSASVEKERKISTHIQCTHTWQLNNQLTQAYITYLSFALEDLSCILSLSREVTSTFKIGCSVPLFASSPIEYNPRSSKPITVDDEEVGKMSLDKKKRCLYSSTKSQIHSLDTLWLLRLFRDKFFPRYV